MLLQGKHAEKPKKKQEDRYPWEQATSRAELRVFSGEFGLDALEPEPGEVCALISPTLAWLGRTCWTSSGLIASSAGRLRKTLRSSRPKATAELPHWRC